MLPALQIEFNKLTNQKAYIFNAQRFIEEVGKLYKTTITAETIDEVKTLREENKIIFQNIADILGKDEFRNDENEIDESIIKGINYLCDSEGWAELAQLGVYLVRNTNINYRIYGFMSLKKFIESRNIFEIKYEQISPNAKNVDTAYVRLKNNSSQHAV
jgi:hypothetical protein